MLSIVAAIIGLASLVLIAFGLCRRRPLFALGIFWFFAGHALTASVISLELVQYRGSSLCTQGVYLDGNPLSLTHNPFGSILSA